MKKMLINAAQADELRVAITDNGQLLDLDIERPSLGQTKSNIYKGKITSIEPSLAAVFVNYGADRHGFLPLKEISREYFLKDVDPAGDLNMNEILKVGQPIVVQVDKEERGTKGAALTTFISLAGSYLVLMPNNPRAGGISRRIEGEDRDKLRDTLAQLTVPDGMGVIIRTAGVAKSAEELQWDLDYILRYWTALLKAAGSKNGHYLIHQESDVVIRALRDNLRQDVTEVIIDSKEVYEKSKEYLAELRPDFADRIKCYQDAMPLFSRFQVEQQIETAYQREVRLPSGGSLVIDHTEALVSVDINSARATKGKSIEETALNTNVEAAREVARQLRLRDIGGLIVIDFIDMVNQRNQREVENQLRDALSMDRARIQTGRISRFGLLEMSRQRLRSSLSKSARATCPRCNGTGAIRGVESLAHSILHIVEEQAAKVDHIHFQIQAPVDVATFLINEQRSTIEDIETRHTVNITIVPNPHIQSPHYHIRQIKQTGTGVNAGGVPSYKLLRSAKPETPGGKPQREKRSAGASASQEPAINQFLATDLPAATKARPGSEGVIKRLMHKMFGASEAKEEKPVETKQGAQQQRGNRQPNNRRNNNSGQNRNRSNNGQNRQRNTRDNRQSPRERNNSAVSDKETQPSENSEQANSNPSNSRQSNNRQPNNANRTRRGSRGGQSRNQNAGDKLKSAQAPDLLFPQEVTPPVSPSFDDVPDMDNIGNLKEAPKNTTSSQKSNSEQKREPNKRRTNRTRRPRQTDNAPTSGDIKETAISDTQNTAAPQPEKTTVEKPKAEKPKATPKPVAQKNVEQRPMTAGKRIAPPSSEDIKAAEKSLADRPVKKAYEPGRKISGPSDTKETSDQ